MAKIALEKDRFLTLLFGFSSLQTQNLFSAGDFREGKAARAKGRQLGSFWG
jgi:hypothetical protein